MKSIASSSFTEIRNQLNLAFLAGRDTKRVDVGEWQSTDVSDRPEMVTHELQDVVIEWEHLPQSVEALQAAVPANQPWAESHFLERVFGTPYNPPPSHKIWPHAQAGNDGFMENGKFSHTYPERFWPQHARTEWREDGQGVTRPFPLRGIRFRYGDLDDVMDLMVRNPLTRQAYLPIWFPEDTGVHHRQRVPCTLGYHFLIRDGKLTVTYFIRSCDFRRHFADDVYFAARLAQWVANDLSEQLEESQGLTVRADRLIMHVVSLHLFEGDLRLMHAEYGRSRPEPKRLTNQTALRIQSSTAELAKNLESFKW